MASMGCPVGLQCDMAGNAGISGSGLRDTKLHVFLGAPGWLSPVECVTLDLEVVSSSPTLGVEIT